MLVSFNTATLDAMNPHAAGVTLPDQIIANAAKIRRLI
jgi:hypothetical protein